MQQLLVGCVRNAPHSKINCRLGFVTSTQHQLICFWISLSLYPT